ncbi:MFS transporter [Clostridium sp. A1-XYC3]|uniref:MFS transporter n=2 Tax=Clostridium tanneri TaxID=3037988 RepID=A0ABU4JXS8_9CLOT|nr:MFS transporter [Clostridium sp. A1-XYC3]MDW8802953.1 MFS transporter [Clostridium sp. A1-XYC3]
MILTAICDSVRGIFIPVLKNDFSINNTSIGIMLTSASLGYIIFTYIGGILCEKIGQKKVYILSYIFMIIPLFILAVSPNFIVFLLAIFLLNIGQSLLSIATNTLVPVLFLSFQAVLMNLTHFCYGAGSAFAQRAAGVMLYRGVTWRKIYIIIALYALVLFILFIFVKIPEPHRVKETSSIDKKSIFKNKLLYFYIFALGFYVFAETGTGNWFINYMERSYHYNKNESSLYIAMFFTVFAIGRLVGGFIIEKVGYINSVLISSIMAFVLYVFGLVLGEKGVIIVSISGFFFAIVFPTIVLTISKVFKEGSSYITGVIVTFASATSMLMNLFMGYLNDKVSSYAAYWLIPISLIFSVAFTYLIFVSTKNQLLKK